MPLTLLTVTTFAMAMAPGAGFNNNPLSAFEWKNRFVLIFGNAFSPDVAEQADAFSARQAEADERDLVVLTVIGGIVSDHGSHEALPTAGALRRKFRISDQTPFTIILVGKDGGEKLRETRRVDPATLFALIDSMPMRRREMGED